jgi:hypothetical protein
MMSAMGVKNTKVFVSLVGGVTADSVVRPPIAHAQRVVKRPVIQLELDVTVLPPTQKRVSCGQKTCNSCGNVLVCSGFTSIGQLGHKG